MTILDDEIQTLNQLPEEIRKQSKFDLIVALMQHETANFQAGIYVSLLAGFAIAVMNTGFDPIRTLTLIGKHSRDECRRLLKEQGLSEHKPNA